MTLVIPVSTVPAVIAYLVPAIKEQIGTDPLPVQLSVGEEGPDTSPDIVVIGEVRRQPTPLAMTGSGGPLSLYETYELDLIASTWTGAGADSWDTTQQLALTARVWQLVAYVETACRLDESLGGLVLIARPSATVCPGPQWTSDANGKATGMKCEAGFSLHVEASL